MIDWLIIGAGISGSYLAHSLRKRGLQVTVLEKSRGVGGRLCSRRTTYGNFLHGAQFFTIRHPAFQQEMEPYLCSQTVRPWKGPISYITKDFKHLEATPEIRYSIYPETSTFCKAWLQDCQVYLQHRVTQLHWNKHWHIQTSNGSIFQARNVVISAPLPQTAELLPADLIASEKIDVSSSWKTASSLMLRFHDDFTPPFGAAFVKPTVIDFIASQESRIELSERKNWTFVLDDIWTKQHWKQDTSLAISHVRKAMQQLQLPIPADIIHQDLHFWKYAQPNIGSSKKQFYPAIHLGLTGEVFQAGRVEGAFLSSLKLIEQLQTDGYIPISS